MTATTPNRQIPYPAASDPISAYPAVAAAAAGILDTHTHPQSDTAGLEETLRASFRVFGAAGAQARLDHRSLGVITDGTGQATIAFTEGFGVAPTVTVTASVGNTGHHAIVVSLLWVTVSEFRVACLGVRHNAPTEYVNDRVVDLSYIAAGFK